MIGCEQNWFGANQQPIIPSEPFWVIIYLCICNTAKMKQKFKIADVILYSRYYSI